MNVSLCKLSLNEYGPTLPLAAALRMAYSRSRASKSEYLAVIVEDLRLLSQGSLDLEPWTATAAATDVRDDVVLEDGEAWPLWISDTSSMEVCSGEEVGYRRKSRAWSGWRRALLGLLMLGVGDGTGDDAAQAAGEGETCK